MLKIIIPEGEFFNSETSEFYYTKEQTLLLEHSLVSISKWESKWKKPFMSREKRTIEETIDYIRCMTITKGVDPLVYKNITSNVVEQIDAYISDPMTATTFREERHSPNREIVTAEVIYYWMVSLGIPFECEKWHLNKLLTLIKVCSVKNSAGNNKMSQRQVMANNAALNAARRKKLNTKG